MKSKAKGQKAKGKTDKGGENKATRPDVRRWLLPALLGLYVVFSVLLFDPKPATFGDNAIYMILGKSLAAGTGYRNIYLPDAPVHTQYPPGFPLMLAGVTLLCGGINVLASKLLVVLTGIGAMFFIYRLCELTFRKRAWPVMVLFASLPTLVENNHWVLSEIPFLLVTMAALFCLVLADQRPTRAVAARLRMGACGLAVAACFIRTAGVAVVLGVLLFFLVRHRYRDLVLLLLLFAATTIPWQLHNTRASHAQPYFEQLLAKNPYFPEQGRAGIADWVTRVWLNLRDYVARAIPRMLFPTREDSWYEAIAGIILSLPMALGFFLSFRKSAPAAPAQKLAGTAPAWQLASAAPVRQFGALQSCAVFAAPLLLCWPHVWASERFLLPFLPLVVVFLFYGVDWLGAKLGWRRFAPAFIGALVLANTVHMASLARKAVSDNLGYLRGDRYSGYEIDWRRYFEAIDWIKETPADAVVLARKPEFVYLLSGRRSFCYPFSDDHAEVKSAILRSQYVLVDNFRWTDLTVRVVGPVLSDNPDLWELAFTTSPPESYVLRVKPGVQPANQPASADH